MTPALISAWTAWNVGLGVVGPVLAPGWLGYVQGRNAAKGVGMTHSAGERVVIGVVVGGVFGAPVAFFVGLASWIGGLAPLVAVLGAFGSLSAAVCIGVLSAIAGWSFGYARAELGIRRQGGEPRIGES